MMTLTIWIIALALVAYFIYKKGTKSRNYFKRNNIKGPEPYFLLGNNGTIFFTKQSTGKWLSSVYSRFPAEKIIGIFDFTSPVYFLRDPELIKHLTVKEFDHFPDHQKFLDSKNEPMFGSVLTTLSGQKWRDMRSTLSPAFTGSKMRQMFELVRECGEQMSQHFQKESRKMETQILDMKELFARYTNDVIASCAFGIKIDSQEDKDNIFYNMGIDIMKFTKWQTTKFLVMRTFPKVASFLRLKFVDSKITTFFRSLITDAMTVRKEKGIVRPDMINLIMQVRQGSLKHEEEKTSKITEGFATVAESNIGKAAVKREWTDDELIAQCLLFFLAGFDTSSNLLAFVANELALNPDVQTKLHDEIVTVHSQLEGKSLSYDRIQSMPYLDMVISETLRKWPPAPFTDRVCVKDYQLEEDGNLKVDFRKDDKLWIPIYALHHDAQYFPNPEQFDPERFSAENVGNIVAGTYLPFGTGPRNCIGSRFALMQIKVVLYHLVKDFSFEICEKTVLPLDMGIIKPVQDKGIHLGLKIRRV